MKWWLWLVMVMWWHSSFGQIRFDVVISEIMADPSPVVGLPNIEWIELTNTSSTAWNLQGWQLRDATLGSGGFPSYMLAPDSSVIICATANIGAMAVFGKVIGVTSFPSLDNDGDVLQLLTSKGLTVHGVNYQLQWHENILKSNGGWSLEMKDIHKACVSKGNWSSSTAVIGGTPGRTNSIAAIISDHDPPHVIRSFAADSVSIHVLFDKSLDSTQSVSTRHYEINGGGELNNIVCLAPLFNEVILKTKLSIETDRVYTLNINGVNDCLNNEMMAQQVVTGRSYKGDSNNVVINEILFNPRSNAFDYVEIYNPGPYTYDLSQFYLSNRNGQGNVNPPVSVSKLRYHLYPGQFAVCTEDLARLQKEYLVKDPVTIMELSGLPSYPDDKGTVILLNGQGKIIDEVHYDEKWHFELINDKEGVALERIHAKQSSMDSHNWHSAAGTAGYGTPGYINSQVGRNEESNEWITLKPSTISPDNDGRDDVLTIYYSLPEPGFVGTIDIYDIEGRKIKTIARQTLLGIKGQWNWDGTDDNRVVQPIGHYVLLASLFNLKGEVKKIKKLITVIRQR